MSFKILCCDGGGIRGVITALLIQDLDKSFGIVAGANGFAGTSTGGLISLGLVNGVAIGDIVNVYENDGATNVVNGPSAPCVAASLSTQTRVPSASAISIAADPALPPCATMRAATAAAPASLMSKQATNAAP